MNWCFPWCLSSLCSFCIFKGLLQISLLVQEDYDKSPWVLHQEEYGVEDGNCLILGFAGMYFMFFQNCILCFSFLGLQIHRGKICPTCSILRMLDVCSLISLKLVLFSSWGSFPLMNNNWTMKNLSGRGLLVSSSAGTFRAFIIIYLQISVAHCCLGSKLTLHRKATCYYYLLITDKYQNYYNSGLYTAQLLKGKIKLKVIR